MVQVHQQSNRSLMNIVNRVFIFVKPKNPFISWAQSNNPEIIIDENAEGSVYLIEECFLKLRPFWRLRQLAIFRSRHCVKNCPQHVAD